MEGGLNETGYYIRTLLGVYSLTLTAPFILRHLLQEGFSIYHSKPSIYNLFYNEIVACSWSGLVLVDYVNLVHLMIPVYIDKMKTICSF